MTRRRLSSNREGAIMSRTRVPLRFILCAAALLAEAPSAPFAQSVPSTMNYQGRLTDNSPAPAPINSTLPMRFGIWDSAAAGSELWAETWDTPNPQVVVNNGLFDLILG